MLYTILLAKLAILLGILTSSIQGKYATCNNRTICVNGVILPKWNPIDVGFYDSLIRAIVYFLAMMYSFLGVSIIADRFMSAIERITSEEKEVAIKLKTGQDFVLRIRVWNETVSNLTLMALGSSAPEILLSIIEIFGKNFEAGSLGPGTIVGSAAFNLFLIIGICIMVIPEGETREIKHLPVFAVTATSSIAAYGWLYIIIGVLTPGIVDIWEAIVTFMLFPLTVLTAYLADKRLFIDQCGERTYFLTRRNAIHKGDIKKRKKLEQSEAIEFDQIREQYIQTIRQLRRDHPDTNLQGLEKMALTEVASKAKKSRAYYIMMTTRMFTGGGNLMNQAILKLQNSASEASDESLQPGFNVQRVLFDPCHYTVMENVGVVSLTVKRRGGFLGSTIKVDYQTIDGTAIAVQDYIAARGTLKFLPYETEKTIDITIVDDDIFEEDEHFCVKLSNLKVKDGKLKSNYEYEISKTEKATIMILDDDHSGVFYFESAIQEINESCGVVQVVVKRSTGARGVVRVPFRTINGSAKKGIDYAENSGHLIFDNEEIIKKISIKIFDNGKYERNEFFLVQLEQPELIKGRLSLIKSQSRETLSKTEKVQRHQGLPKLGDCKETKIVIRENTGFKIIIDKMLKVAQVSMKYGATTWTEQFQEAVSVNSGELDEDGHEVMPSLHSFILHYLTIFWKVLFAFVPPTEYLGGWLCFGVSVTCIGVLTALIGDLASSFGCSIGLMDEVTAITFVAVGTSLPDTFASKIAAINDSTADASIGNVTGSNAVNVYLGLGLAWTLASVVHASRGTNFHVPIGSLGYSVTVFCILAFLAVLIILSRRHPIVGGELGGPLPFKLLSAGVLFSFFLIYVILSSLKAYCHI